MAIWRVTVAGTLYTVENWANVFHIDATTPPGAATLDAFEAAYATPATGGGMAWLNPCPGTVATGFVGVIMNTISMQAVVSPAPPTVRAVAHNGGQNTPGGLPLDVALCVSWTTGLAGRSFRGRTYLPPWHQNQNTDAGPTVPRPSATSVAGCCVNARKLILDLSAAGTPLVVYSRKLTSAQIVTGGYMDSSWDTQRRRGVSIPKTKTAFTTP